MDFLLMLGCSLLLVVGMAEVSLPYQPRPLQKALHALAETVRFLVVVCHRQFGKTTFAIIECIWAVLFSDRDRPQAAYVCPFRSQAKAVAWELLKFFCRIIPGVSFNETELRADFPGGGRIVLAGADNPDILRGMYFDLVVLDEYPLMEPRVWQQVIRPTLTSRQGRAIFIYTPFGPNHGLALWDQASTTVEWGRVMYKASDSGVLSAEELASAQRAMPAETYEQEMECSFTTAIHGTIYAPELARMEQQERITHVPHRAGRDVHTCWDIGFGDSTDIWFAQVFFPAIHLIDFYQASGAGIEHYIRILREKADTLGYRYGIHYGPHDTLAGSIQTGMSLADTAREAGLRFRVVKRGPVETGISETRKLLDVAWIDRAKCGPGLEALQAYRRTWDERLRMFSEKPVHNWASHPADALRTGAVGGLAQPPIDPSTIETQAQISWDVWSFGQKHAEPEHTSPAWWAQK